MPRTCLQRRCEALILASWSLGQVCVIAGSAQAQGMEPSCGRAGRPWVALVWAGDPWQPALRDDITADLRAGLRLRGIDVCALGTAGSEPPLALVQLGSTSGERVSVTIEVHDAVTEKRVLRDVDLRLVTPDGRGLSVAQAAEELLRASWAELALDDAPKPTQPAPVEVTRAVMPVKRSPQAARELGTRFAMEHHTSGQTLVGGDALLLLWLGRSFAFELALGGRQGLSVSAAHGSVDSSAMVGSLALLFALSPPSARVAALLTLGGQLVDLRLSGRASALGQADTGSALAIGAQAGLRARVGGSRSWHLDAELGPGLPLRGVAAADAGRRISGTLGVEVHGGLGLGVGF